MKKIDSRFIDEEMATDEEVSDAVQSKVDISMKNQPNGYAGLDSSGKIPANLFNLIDGGNPSSVFDGEIDGGDVSGN